MYTQSRAVVAHRTAGRIRLKISERRGDAAYFAALQRVFAADPDVLKVSANARTGSVIIWCVEGFEFGEGSRFLGLEVVEGPAPLGTADQVRRNAVALDDRLHAASGGELSLATFITKLILAVATGQVLGQLLEWAVESFVQRARRRASQAAAAVSFPAQLAAA